MRDSLYIKRGPGRTDLVDEIHELTLISSVVAIHNTLDRLRLDGRLESSSDIGFGLDVAMIMIVAVPVFAHRDGMFSVLG